ncbi:hypothetical protein PMZ80_011263 [Knufia obscura]|uniref:Uncharacterized protein n=1 Tax=Knufia obscura TaxID=1635080 RepID=A0ABR0R780_9EURO|nr:hypothetical protein PMZ80_011263 [Knufia obscura]
MVNFLSLPTEIRNKIYEQVLVIPHPLYLFQEPGFSVDTFAPDKPFQWPALLYTNRQIHGEASAVLYGMNHFHFVDITAQQVDVLRSFLSHIGITNAASVSHLCVNFPVAQNIEGEPRKFRLRDDSMQALTLLQDKCTSLSTLETVVHYKNSSFFTRTDKFLQEALPQIDAQLRAISSLESIVVRVEVHGQIPTSSAKELMQELGWSVVSGRDL